jgi:outer membrane protein assembly factor BamB
MDWYILYQSMEKPASLRTQPFPQEFRMSDISSQVPPAEPEPEGGILPASAVAGILPASAVPPKAAPPATRRLRLWPGVVIIALMWPLIKVPGWVAAEPMMQFMALFWGPILGAVAVAAWWLFASRLRWADRLLGLAVFAAAGVATLFLWHPQADRVDRSISFMVVIMAALPAVTTAWVGWLLLTPFLRWPVRRAGLLVVFLLAWGYFPLLRLDGIDGSFSSTFRWRWTPTAEDKLMAELVARKPRSAPAAAKVALDPGDWPGFRGPDRDGRRTGVRIATDWQQSPPRELWRHRVGPGWGSFAVVGTRLYTQEQRGKDEVVVCYDADNGEELWAHQDAARFSEVVAGPGPRATPTFHEGKVYALGATGRLNCLDAATGKRLWSRDIVDDSGATVPQWGFAASPLVARGVVTVFAGGPDGKSVLGYHASSGDLAWSAGEGRLSYCSPHLARLGGVEQVLITTDAGLTAFDPARGEVLWRHSWPVKDMARIVQPAVLSDTDVLIGTGMNEGTRRVRVSHPGDGWADKEVWTTKAIKPYYNDMVVYQGHLYGFDGPFFTCVSLEDGRGRWRARGYGNGQVLLLADQGLLLVLTEKTGEVALLEASPEGRKELGRFRALALKDEDKTWNHPVVAHGKLFVRNGEEAVCYQLAEDGSGGAAGE